MLDNTPRTGRSLKFSKTKMSALKANNAPGAAVSDGLPVPKLAMTMFASSKKVGSGAIKKGTKRLRADGSQLPDTWRNNVVPDPDTKINKNGTKELYYVGEKEKYLDPTPYKLATQPQAQKKCGSCFAFACATAISDAFVFGKKLDYNPLNSPLDLMSCVDDDSNDKCDGGNPLGVLSYLAENKGIASSRCISYDDWTDGKMYADWVSGKIKSDEAVPLCAGCYIKQCSSKPKTFRYKIKPPVYLSSTDINTYNANGEDKDNKIDGVGDQVVYQIKEHLMNYGAAVTGFVVLNNFLADPDGAYKETNGIYFEHKTYKSADEEHAGKDTKGAEKTKGDDPFLFAGGHAVCIVGWGISADDIKIQIPNDSDPKNPTVTLKRCPYWIARNSWGKDWGQNGYFKMAMYQKIGEYEINPNVAFERFRAFDGKMYNEETKTVVPLKDPIPIGGVILIKPDEIVEETTEPRDPPEYTKDATKKLYCSEEAPKIGTEKGEKGESDEKHEKTNNGSKLKNSKDKPKKKSNIDEIDEHKPDHSWMIWVLVVAVVCGIAYYLYKRK
jgi:hypothetical protein